MHALIRAAQLQIGKAAVENVAFERAAVGRSHRDVFEDFSASRQRADITDDAAHFLIGELEGGHSGRRNASADHGRQLLIVAIGRPLDDPGSQLASVAVASVAGSAMALELFPARFRALRERDGRDGDRDNGGSERSYHLYIVPDTARRLLYLRVAIVAGALAGMALSYKLWLSARFYPLTPVFPFLKPIPHPFDYVLFGGALLALACCAFTARLIPIFATLAVALALGDQSRWQPWFYQYFFLLLGVALASPNACRLIVASIYFWSGAQKLNSGFIHNGFPWLLEPILRHLPQRAQALAHPLSLVAPFIEIWIGLALLSRKFRTPAIVAALAMHLFILLSLGPLGQNYNYVVWPWNIAIASAVVILFWKSTESARQVLFGEGPFHIAVLLLFSVAPAFSFFGFWDHYLSSAMYASNENHGLIYISDQIFDRLPDGIAEYVRVETPELDSIDIGEWSANELNVPPYPEVRIYKNVARKICEYAESPTQVRLSIVSKSIIGKSITGTSYSCAALKN